MQLTRGRKKAVSKPSSTDGETLDSAERVREFIRGLTHTKGEWAGQPFQLLPWQWEETIRPLFGTMQGDRRQYRMCYVEVPKKNGKSELGAAIALYMLCADKEPGPEVYSAAADRGQASIVFDIAAQMVAANPVLSKICKVLHSNKTITNYRNNGRYRVLSAEAYSKHGINPSAIIFDELHAQPNDELWRVLTSGTDYARRQQLIFVMSTAGIFDKESIWWRVREKARQIRDGIVEDPTFLPVLYLADPEKDDPGDEELWKRVNPSLGRIFSLDKIRADYQVARQNPVDFADFCRYRLNIPIKHRSRWLPMDDWDKCAGEVDAESLKGRPCYGGLDLSSKIDLSAYVLVFPPQSDGELWRILPFFYAPEDTIMQRSRQDSVHYEVWAKRGQLRATPGNVIDISFIEKDIMQSAKDYDLREIGYDPWGATELATRLLNQEGIQMVEIRQGAKSMSEPMKDILVKVKRHEIAHGGHPLLRWCGDNLTVAQDANENLRPDKSTASDRIDGFVALINAWARAMFAERPAEVGITIL